MAKKKQENLVTVDTDGGGTVTNLRIKPLDVRKVLITIGQAAGTLPVLVNNVANKGIDIDGTQRKGKSKTPHDEFLSSLYFIGNPKNEVYGLKVMGFKHGMATMAKDLSGINAKTIKRTIQIAADEPTGELVKLRFKKLTMADHIVRVLNKSGTRVPCHRYRGSFEGWEVDLSITYNGSFLGLEDVVNLVACTGEFIGWGELRPEQGGQYGKWVVKSVTETVAAR